MYLLFMRLNSHLRSVDVFVRIVLPQSNTRVNFLLWKEAALCVSLTRCPHWKGLGAHFIVLKPSKVHVGGDPSLDALASAWSSHREALLFSCAV